MLTENAPAGNERTRRETGSGRRRGRGPNYLIGPLTEYVKRETFVRQHDPSIFGSVSPSLRKEVKADGRRRDGEKQLC